MSKHTPGPWKVDNTGYFYPHLHIVKREEFKQRNITVIPRGMVEKKQKEIKANAHLIAAAPEMYASIDKFLIAREEEDMYHMEEAVDDMREALVKAEGEINDT